MHGLSVARALPSPQVRPDTPPIGATLLSPLTPRLPAAQATFRAAPSPAGRAPRRAAPARPRAAGGDDAEPPANGVLSSQFLGVLQQSLARAGPDALTRGVEASDEARTSAVEEVLSTALHQSKHTLRMLQQWRLQIDSQIAAQEKQVSRMEFALNKARNDAALMKTLKQMVYEQADD